MGIPSVYPDDDRNSFGLVFLHRLCAPEAPESGAANGFEASYPQARPQVVNSPQRRCPQARPQLCAQAELSGVPGPSNVLDGIEAGYSKALPDLQNRTNYRML